MNQCKIPNCFKILSGRKHLCNDHMAKVPAKIVREMNDAWDRGDQVAHKQAVTAAIQSVQGKVSKRLAAA